MPRPGFGRGCLRGGGGRGWGGSTRPASGVWWRASCRGLLWAVVLAVDEVELAASVEGLAFGVDVVLPFAEGAACELLEDVGDAVGRDAHQARAEYRQG